MAEEPPKVRLVRCPKCQNLLTELPDYSIYECGGCGALLQGKTRKSEAGKFSDKSDEARVGAVREKSKNSDKLMVKLGVLSGREVELNGGSPQTEENREVASESNGITGAADMSLRNDQVGIKRHVEKNRTDHSSVSDHKWADNDFDMSMDRDNLHKESGEREVGGGKSRIQIPSCPERSEKVAECHWERNEMKAFQRRQRSPISMYPDEGPSNYQSSSFNGFTEPLERRYNPDEYIEQDPTELLRKLDELKDQITRSCNLNEKPKEKVTFERRMVPPRPYGISRPPYHGHYPELFLHANNLDMDFPSLYPPTHATGHMPGYSDPFRSQRPNRDAFYSGQYMDGWTTPSETCRHGTIHHHSSCSCTHCYKSTATCNKGFSGGLGPWSYNPRPVNPPPLNFHRQQAPHMRWLSGLNLERGGFNRSHPNRGVQPLGGRRCCPVAGGAPFITCHNCFEVLQLPKNILVLEKNNKKLRCGACSAITLFSGTDKKLIVSPIQEETGKACNKVDDSCNVANLNSCSSEYVNFGYDFQEADREHVSSSTGQILNSSNSKEQQSVRSSSFGTSEDQGFSGGLKATVSPPPPPPPGSPLKEYFEYSNNNHRKENGNNNRRDQEKLKTEKATARQNSIRDATMATEMDVSFNEYSNTGLSQDSGDTSREDRGRSNKLGESFFAGIIKGFRDFSRSNQPAENGRTSVSVNGHPIPDRLVKTAEEKSGPIEPGHYWYDIRAGFWGVMDGPCLGIIPAYIEEFNFVMPEKCSSGNTYVFVNGRELHQRDLDLLSSRGLPSDKDRSYIIEMSGRVLDEDTGAELDSLGKLAPTVEKAKRGFGMRVPRVPA